MLAEDKIIEDNILIEMEKTIRIVREAFNSEFHKYQFNVSYDQWLIIDQVQQKQGISQIEIANNTGKDRASISRIIKNLLTKNLLTKTSNESNKRANKVYLSPAGLELSEKINSVYIDIYKRQFDGIYEQELNLLKEILVRINHNNYVSSEIAV